jgi:hypothetical protein
MLKTKQEHYIQGYDHSFGTTLNSFGHVHTLGRSLRTESLVRQNV